jgi:N4-gp56 family major capsid protein
MSSTLFNKVAQDRLTKNFVFYRFADKKRLPKNSGQVMQFNRYVTVAGTTATIAEGTLTAGEVNISADTATLTFSSYGQFTTITQTLTDTNRTTVIEEATEVLADGASDTVDLLCMYNYAGNATLRVANGKTTGTITNGDKLTGDELRAIVRDMQLANVRPFDEGGNYVGIYSPAQTYDLQGDTSANTSWTEVHKYTDKPVTNMFGMELGALWGVRLIRSNNVLTASVTSSVTNSAYQGYVIGKHAQAAVSLTENPIEMIVKLPGSGGTYDPYNNICTVAYKLPYFGVKWLGFGTDTGNAKRAYRNITCVSA